MLDIVAAHKDTHRIIIGIDSLGKEEVLVAIAQVSFIDPRAFGIFVWSLESRT